MATRILNLLCITALVLGLVANVPAAAARGASGPTVPAPPAGATTSVEPPAPSAPTQAGGPDEFGYTFKDSNEPGGPIYAWEELSPTGTLVQGWSSNPEGYAGPIPIGFSFNYYGNDYTELYANTSGYMNLGDPYGWTPWGDLPNSSEPNNDIGLLGDYLYLYNYGSDSAVYYQTLSNPTRFVLEFVRLYDCCYNGNPRTFEVILYPNGDIVAQYNTLSWMSSDYVGIENANGTVGLDYGVPVQDGLAIRYQYPQGIITFPSQQVGFGQPGDAVTYQQRLSNYSGQSDSFTVGVAGNAWTTTLSLTQTGVVPDGGSITVTVQVTVPPSVLPGDQDVATLLFTSVASPSLSASATLSTTAVGPLAYVPLSSDADIAVVDTAGHQVIDTIDLWPAGCFYPGEIEITPDGRRLFVECGGSSLAVVDTASRSVVHVIPNMGWIYAPTFTADGGFLLVIQRLDMEVWLSVIDTYTYAVVRNVPLPMWSNRILVHPSLDRVYISGGGAILVLDTQSWTTIAEIPEVSWGDMAISPDGHWLFVAYSDFLYVFDTLSNTLYTDVDIPFANEVAVAPDGSEIYVGNEPYGWEVAVVDGQTFQVTAGISLSGVIEEMALTCDGSELYVTNGESELMVVDTASRSQVAMIEMPGYYVYDLAICPQHIANELYLSPAEQNGHALAGEVALYEGRLTNRTGQDDTFTLALSGQGWDAELSPTNTGLIPDGGSITYTVWVTVPMGANPGSWDKALVHASSATFPSVYSDTAAVKTWAACSDPLNTSGQTTPTYDDVDDTYSFYGDARFTHLYIYAHSGGDGYLYARVSAHDTATGSWVTLAEVTDSGSGLLIDTEVPSRYNQVRVQMTAQYYEKWYEYSFDYCRRSAVVLEPSDGQGGAGPGETAVYELTLTNWAMHPEQYRLSVDSGWTATLSITETGLLTDGESVPVILRVQVPAGAVIPMSDTATLLATSVGTPVLTATATAQTAVRPNRVSFFATARELYGYWAQWSGQEAEPAPGQPAPVPEGGSATLPPPPALESYPSPGVMVIATEDDTSFSLRDLATGAILASAEHMNRYDTEMVTPPEGTYFKVEADRPVMAYETDFSAHAAFLPSLSGGPVGNEFFMYYLAGNGFFLYAIEDTTIEIYDADGSLVDSQTMQAGQYWSLGILPSEVYHVYSSGKITMQCAGLYGNFTTVPAADGDGLGTLFYFAARSAYGSYPGFAVMAYDDADVTVYSMDGGPALYTRHLLAGEYWWQVTDGGAPLRLESTGQVEVWAGGSTDGTLPGLSSDKSFASGWDGRFFHLYSLDEGSVLFAPFDMTEVRVDDQVYTLRQDEYMRLPAGQYVQVVASKPVLIQNTSGGYSYGTYLGGVNDGLLPAQVHLLPEKQFRQAVPGQVVTYEEWLFNALDQEESFALSLDSAWPASLSLDQTGLLPPGDWLTFTVAVTVPLDAAWYEINPVTVQATSLSDPGVYTATALLTTEVYSSPNILVTPSALTASLTIPDVATRTLTIANGFGVPLAFTLTDEVREVGLGDDTPLVPGIEAMHYYTTTDDNEDNAHSGYPDDDMDDGTCPGYPDEPIEFNIFVDYVEGATTASLTLRALVFGLPDAEYAVSLNGVLLGNLSGSSNDWSRYTLAVPVGLLVEGANLVQVDLLSNYCAYVDWGELAISLPGAPWLDETPSSGQVPTNGSQEVAVTFHSGGAQPGEYYAAILVDSNDPDTPLVEVPVTMTVVPSASMGWVEGLVTDAWSGAPLPATVLALGQPYTVIADPATGYYRLWLDAGSYTLQAAAPGYVTATAAVEVVAQQGVTQDLALELNVPLLQVEPGALQVAHPLGAVSTRTLTVTNAGPAPLHYRLLEGQSARSIGVTHAVAWTLYVDRYEYENLLNAIGQYYGGLEVVETMTMDPGTLEAALQGQDLVLIPVQPYIDYYYLYHLGYTWTGVLQRFLSRGGTIVVFDSNNSRAILDGAGLLVSDEPIVYSDVPLSVLMPEHPLVAGVPTSFIGADTTMSYPAAEGDWVVVDEYYGSPAVVARQIGQGHVALLGFSFSFYDDNTARLAANAVQWSGSVDIPWLAEEPLTGTVPAYSSAPVVVTMDALTYTAGTYTAELLVQSDDPRAPEASVPVTMTVIELADVSVTLSAPPAVQVGDTFAYSVAYANAGSSPASAVQITDTLPAGVRYVDDTAPFPHFGSGSGPIRWTAGTLASGESGAFLVTVTLDSGQGGSLLTNTLAIATGSPEEDLSDNRAVAVTRVACGELPVAAFSPTEAAVAIGEALTLTNESMGMAPLAYLWSFGDGTSSTLTSPVHSYAVAGSYEVQLEVTDGCGVTDVATGTVQVCGPLAAAWTPSATQVAVGEVLTFTNGSTGTAPLSYRWSFGDGASSTVLNPVHAYAATGSYTVTLVVTDGCLQQEQAVGTITVVMSRWRLYLPLVLKGAQ